MELVNREMMDKSHYFSAGIILEIEELENNNFKWTANCELHEKIKHPISDISIDGNKPSHYYSSIRSSSNLSVSDAIDNLLNKINKINVDFYYLSECPVIKLNELTLQDIDHGLKNLIISESIRLGWYKELNEQKIFSIKSNWI